MTVTAECYSHISLWPRISLFLFLLIRIFEASVSIVYTKKSNTTKQTKIVWTYNTITDTNFILLLIIIRIYTKFKIYLFSFL